MLNTILSVAGAGTIAVVDNQKITLDIDTVDNAVFTQQGADLIISKASGSEAVRLENFFTIAAGELPPLLSLADGSVLSAVEVTDLVENFNAAAIEPAAGGSAGGGASGGGAGFANFDGGSIGDGIETNDLLGATELEFEAPSQDEFVAELVEDSCVGETFIGDQFTEGKDQRSSLDDTLVGTDCDDTFIGGMGNDNLTGGEGADEFVYPDEYGFGESCCFYFASDGHDTIEDFNAAEGDKINLDAVFDHLGIDTDNRADMVNVDGGNRLTIDGVGDFSIQIEGDTIGSFSDAADLLAMGIDVGTADVS